MCICYLSLHILRCIHPGKTNYNNTLTDIAEKQERLLQRLLLSDSYQLHVLHGVGEQDKTYLPTN